MPLLLCDPGLIETLLDVGLASELILLESVEIDTSTRKRADHAVQQRLDAESLHYSALKRFATMYASYVIPIILFSKPKLDTSKELSEDDIGSHRRKYFTEAACLLTDDVDDGMVTKVIEYHLHDIYALVYPMVEVDRCELDCATVREDGMEVIRYLHTFIPESRLNHNAARIARKLVLRLLASNVEGSLHFMVRTATGSCVTILT